MFDEIARPTSSAPAYLTANLTPRGARQVNRYYDQQRVEVARDVISHQAETIKQSLRMDSLQRVIRDVSDVVDDARRIVGQDATKGALIAPFVDDYIQGERAILRARTLKQQWGF
jgi:hypothetical protein